MRDYTGKKVEIRGPPAQQRKEQSRSSRNKSTPVKMARPKPNTSGNLKKTAKKVEVPQNQGSNVIEN
jgi:hypothetical protein